MNQKSEFTGTLLDNIAVNIVTFLLLLVTLGFGLPFAVTYKQRWVASNTYINGRQLKFVGSGGDLLVQWIKWFILILITLGIYGLWVNLKFHQWVVRNTVFND
jgi:uncharacterized membrane protein YjgN (DUF898 family)